MQTTASFGKPKQTYGYQRNQPLQTFANLSQIKVIQTKVIQTIVIQTKVMETKVVQTFANQSIYLMQTYTNLPLTLDVSMLL